MSFMAMPLGCVDTTTVTGIGPATPMTVVHEDVHTETEDQRQNQRRNTNDMHPMSGQ